MTNFLDLPAEIRVMIYGHAFRDRAVKFIRGLQDTKKNPVKLADSASLLICSKAIHDESRPFFFQMVRVDVTTVLDRETGMLRSKGLDSEGNAEVTLDIEPALLQHIKARQIMFAGQGMKKLYKSLTNLKSMTYYDAESYYICEDAIWEDSECCCVCGSCAKYDDALVGMAECDVEEYPGKIIGKCCNPGSDLYSMNASEECLGELPIRSFVGAWDWNGKPFELIAEVEFLGDSMQPIMLGRVDMRSRVMTLTKLDKMVKVIGKFKIESLTY